VNLKLGSPSLFLYKLFKIHVGGSQKYITLSALVPRFARESAISFPSLKICEIMKFILPVSNLQFCQRFLTAQGTIELVLKARTARPESVSIQRFNQLCSKANSMALITPQSSAIKDEWKSKFSAKATTN
jgi:hypothetical protein